MHSKGWKVALLVAGTVLAPLISFGAESSPRGFQSRVFVDAQGAKHPFVVFVPAAYQRGQHPPVMLFLHGSGERGGNNIDQMMTGIAPALWKRKTKLPFVVLLPQCRPDSNWLVDGEDAQWALGMLRQVQKEFETDPDRVILTGLSMGGSGTWSIAARDPAAWAAIVPMCGRPDLATAGKLAEAGLPIWNFCGDKDRPETVKANRDMGEALRVAGAKARYTEYPDVGHNCWDNAYGTEELYTWLLEQARSRNTGKRL
jgi:predicted peptidase